MKKKIKFFVTLSILIISFFAINKSSNAQSLKGEIIKVDDRLNVIDEHSDVHNVIYSKRYWTAKWKGEYEFAQIDTYYAVLDYYNSSKDELQIMLLSYIDASYYRPNKDNYIDQWTQYYIRDVEQSVYITGSSANSFSYGISYPSTEKTSYVKSDGLSISLEAGTKESKFGLSFNTTKSETIQNVNMISNHVSDRGTYWKYRSTRDCNETKSAFKSVVCQVFYLTNAKKYVGLQFDAHFSYYAKWHLPVCGWEQYDPYIGDQHNQSIDKLIQFKINI